MTEAESRIFRTLWVHMHDKELAGHFPYELLASVDRAIHPIRCADCRGHNVQAAMMVNLNDQTIGEDFGSWEETDTKWCLDCEKHVRLLMGDEQFEEDEPNKGYDRWMNNEIQFARLICELEAAGLERKTNLYEVAESMDLDTEELESLFTRADKVWNQAKAEADAEMEQRQHE